MEKYNGKGAHPPWCGCDVCVNESTKGIEEFVKKAEAIRAKMEKERKKKGKRLEAFGVYGHRYKP